MRVLLLHLIFTLSSELRTSPRVPAELDNRNMALLQTFDLMVHDLDRFFDEVEFVIDLDFIQRYSKRFISHAFLQIREVKRTINSIQLLWEFKRYLQHDLISYLKLKGFPSYVGITLLTITGGLDTTLDLNNLLSRLVDDLWASELSISNFSPADR
ncbi:hypothetical protein Tco_0065867 [Tanacetum coccineum]